MRALVVVMLVCLSSCKKSSPVVDAGAPPAPVMRALPSAQSTLSLLEPIDAGCEWRTLDPASGATTTLATLPGSCTGARIAWTADTSKALVWFDPEHLTHSAFSANFASKPGFADELRDANAQSRLFSVDVRSGDVKPLAMPPVSDAQNLEDLGLGVDGVPLAFFTETPRKLADDAKTLQADGQTFDLSEIHEGAPAIARAFRFTDGGWSRFETKLTTTGWDYALGASALDAHSKMGPRSAQLSMSVNGGDSAEEKEVQALKKLTPPKAKEDDGAWIFVGAGGVRVYVWQVTAEFAITTGLIASGMPPAPLPQLGFTDGDLVALRTSGPYVLVTASDVGTHPRLYQLPAAKRVFASDSARAVTFWPTTAKPESHEDSH
jgi:hypothetical protein